MIQNSQLIDNTKLLIGLITCAQPKIQNPKPTTHNPQPTTHNPQPTAHNPQPTQKTIS